MIICPYCDAENIDGADICDQCSQPLDDLHLAAPVTLVERSLLTERVRALYSTPPIQVTPGTDVATVLRLLVDKSIGCVLVVDGERLAGVFSERDALIRLNVESSSLADRPVADFMTVNPQTLAVDAKLAFAVRMMDVGGYRHVPVVDEKGRPCGVISARDILRYLTEKMSGVASA